jgi:type II secretory ATPase GspE/PulE/Tfp pilus assembly ATPase PilB-like protein/8-oxo-dGTP pyrophosphatase MutT (NUDIX family)
MEAGMDRATQSSDEWIVPVLRELLTPVQFGVLAKDATANKWKAAVSHGFTTDEAILRAIATRTRMRVAGTLNSSPQALARIPERLARRYSILPLSVSARTIDVATANPYDLDCEQAVAFASGRRVRMSLAVPARITERLEEVYRPASVVDRLLASVGPVSVHHIDQEAEELSATQLADGARERPIVRLVDHIVAEGIAARASDIHLETEEDAMLVRYRVDGVLRTTMTLPRSIGTPLVSRVKIMARMDIADRLRPQGGRALVMVEGERVDLRVSTLPAAHGEKVVIRILDARGGVRALDALGFDSVDAARLIRLLETRDGLILVTGPTGSGKTTTLYSALHALVSRGLNVITVEDPVEYRIPGIVQSQVNEKAGLSFAAALRSILRQDPDVILVGEIRDAETASVAIQAALTGHLVFATLHTIDAASSIARLADLGVDPGKVGTALKGVIAQRLLRRMCSACARDTSDPIPPSLWDCIPNGARLRAGAGCDACAGSGFRGRMAAVELLTMTPGLTRLIVEGAPASVITAAARAEGMRSLWSSGVARVLSGETTPAEVARVLDSESNTAGDEEAGAGGAGFEEQREWQSAGIIPSDNPPYSEHDTRFSPITARARANSMTRIEVGVVDVYLVDPQIEPWRVLALHRAPGTSRGGTWEAVHGKIDSEEVAQDAAIREVLEETGLAPQRLYNVTVHAFYLHKTARIEVAVVFCAFVDSGEAVTLGPEHAEYAWLSIDDAPARFTWPRAAQALAEIRKLLGSGDAGPAEDVLRVL